MSDELSYLILGFILFVLGVGVGGAIDHEIWEQYLIQNGVSIHDPITGEIVFKEPKAEKEQSDE